MGRAGTSTNATTKGKPIAKRPATFWPEPRASPLPSDRLRSGRNQGQAHCQATGYVLAGTKGKPIAKRPATFWPEPRKA